MDFRAVLVSWFVKTPSSLFGRVRSFSARRVEETLECLIMLSNPVCEQSAKTTTKPVATVRRPASQSKKVDDPCEIRAIPEECFRVWSLTWAVMALTPYDPVFESYSILYLSLIHI